MLYLMIAVVLWIVFREKPSKTTLNQSASAIQDKEYLAKEIGRLHFILQVNGIEEKIKLPSWLHTDESVAKHIDSDRLTDMTESSQEIDIYCYDPELRKN